MARMFLSSPHMSGQEQKFVREAFDTNWVSPLGPNVDGFEREFSEYVGVPHAAAVSSGTAALHLALILMEVGRDAEVLCSSFTFSASANAIMYVGAKPVFVDSEASSWNLDPSLVEEELTECAKFGKIPAAVVAVDLYGQCADYARLEPICERFGVPLIEDAAEALGATCGGKQAGRFGRLAAFSFNGNKIITTAGGGMLVSHDESLARRARYLATQARDPAPHYQHSVVGYNYRMSNVLAGIGRGQLRVLDDRVRRRRAVCSYYQSRLAEVPGVTFMPEASYGTCTRWLTCITVDPIIFGASRDDIRQALEAQDIESRPVWKPMHMQPVFAGCRVLGGSVSTDLFRYGLCLPSGSNLTDADLQRVVDIVHGCRGK